MARTGLLGQTLAHSFSPAIHRALGNNNYELFEVNLEDIPTFLQQEDLFALNVTLPYKETVISHLANISLEAKKIGAVNALRRRNDGRWMGHNTDYDGLAYLFRSMQIDPFGKRALILGGGGTAKTARTVLEDLGAREVVQLVRHDGIPYSQLPKYLNRDILVNTTPVGMYPHAPNTLVNVRDFTNLCGVVDVIYNPLRTQLVLEAQDAGIPAVGGLKMLVAQAVWADAFFFDRPVEEKHISRLTQHLMTQQENIVLIGMPGVGKSTVGRHLAETINRPFVDMDICFTDRHKISPAEFIHQYGEKAFRTAEYDITETICLKHGQVIACGGGIVTTPATRNILRQNGRLYWLEGPLEKLAISNRPLSAGGLEHLRHLDAQRRPLYEHFSDVRIPHTSISASVARIKEEFYAPARFKRPQY